MLDFLSALSPVNWFEIIINPHIGEPKDQIAGVIKNCRITGGRVGVVRLNRNSRDAELGRVVEQFNTLTISAYPMRLANPGVQ